MCKCKGCWLVTLGDFGYNSMRKEFCMSSVQLQIATNYGYKTCQNVTSDLLTDSSL